MEGEPEQGSDAGRSPEPRVFELPPSTPVPQLPQPLDRIETPKSRKLTLKFDGRAVAALFLNAASFDALVMVECASGSEGGSIAVDLLLRPAEAAAGGSGSTTAGGSMWTGDAASRLEEAWLARDRGAAVLLRGELRRPDQAGGIVTMERVPCLPQPPALPDTGVNIGRGGRSNQRQQQQQQQRRQQQQQQRRRRAPSVNSSNPADAASARADVLFRAVRDAEKIIKNALQVAVRAEASAARAREVTTKLQQLQDPSGLGLEAAMGAGRAKAGAMNKMSVSLADEGVVGMKAEQDSELEAGRGEAAGSVFRLRHKKDPWRRILAPKPGALSRRAGRRRLPHKPRAVRLGQVLRRLRWRRRGCGRHGRSVLRSWRSRWAWTRQRGRLWRRRRVRQMSLRIWHLQRR